MASGGSNATTDQIREFKKAFKLFDKNRDGKITPDELASGMKKLGFAPSRREVRRLVAEFDSNNSGCIEIHEFLELMMRKLHDQNEENELREVFQLFDRDNDGYITVDDMKYVTQQLGADLTTSEIDQMIADVDKDNDGKVSFKEFVQLVLLDQFL